MPVYSYACTRCGPMEIHQSISDDSLTGCPECGGSEFKKTYNSVGVSFKGKGFYTTDSRSTK